MYITPANTNPLNLHEIPEWHLQNTNLDGNISPSKLAKARNQLSTSSLSSQMQISQMIKILLHYLFLKFINFPSSIWVEFLPIDAFQLQLGRDSKESTCTTIPSLPLPPNHMWKHISCPKFLECTIGAIFSPNMSYMPDVSLWI